MSDIPSGPTPQWPGGWVVATPDAGVMRPHSMLAWPDRGGAQATADVRGGEPAGYRVMWTPYGWSAGNVAIALDADHWRGYLARPAQQRSPSLQRLIDELPEAS